MCTLYANYLDILNDLINQNNSINVLQTFHKGVIMTGAKRHKITSVAKGIDGKMFGACSACEGLGHVRVYAVRKYTLSDGESKMHYRCKNQMTRYTYRRAHIKTKRSTEVKKREAIEAIPSSLAGQINQWEEQQGGHCALCAEYVRKGRGKGRELFVIHDTRGQALKGLFCWDCRNLINQRLTGVMEQAITVILNKERLRLTPPASAGR
jgi:hypothetical protein